MSGAKFDLLEGRYQLLIDHRTESVVIGRIEHIDRKGKHGFGVVLTPVGHLVAFINAGGPEGPRRHWEVQVLLTTSVRYDETTDTTTIVKIPWEVIGPPDETLVLELAALRESSLPLCHPELPRELARALLGERLCAEPMYVRVNHCATQSYLEFGKLFDEND